jgi:hypothetical protein
VPYVCSLSPFSLTKPVTDGFGINIDFTHLKAGELEMIAGFDYVKVNFLWAQTDKMKGVYNFTDYGFLMNELGKQNM